MALAQEFPKAKRNVTGRLRALLESDPALSAEAREDIALGLNVLADNAHDLDEILARLVNEPHTPAEVGELLIAFQLTLGQMLGASDLVNGKLYDIGDRLKKVSAPKLQRRAVSGRNKPVSGGSQGK